MMMMLSGTSSRVVVNSNESRTSEVELEEAAEALACLAHRHPYFNSNSNFNHDVQTPPPNSLMSDLLSERQHQHHHRLRTCEEDPAVVVQKHGEMTSNMRTKPIQTEQINEELEPNHVGTNTPSMGTKMRKHLDEAEKEARRVRRVLANRESARQTIHRRQALYEELTRKAADLAWENGNLKKEKEMATKEYDSLRSTNESLKAQIANITKVEVASPRGDLRLSNNEMPTSPSTHYPVYVYNHQPSLFPLIWPSVVPPSNVVQLQCVPQSGIAIPSQVPVLMSDESHSSPDQSSLTRINVPRTPFYVLPCPWLPFSHSANGLHTQSFDSSVKQKDIVLDNEPRSSSSSKFISHVEKYNEFPLMKMMSKACNSAASLHENLSSDLPGGGGQHLRPQSRGGVIMPVPVRHFKAAGVGHENMSQPKLSCEIEGTPAAAGYPKKGVLEKEPVVSKKQLDSIAAAEARKRRKELKRLKDLHSRQFRLSC